MSNRYGEPDVFPCASATVHPGESIQDAIDGLPAEGGVVELTAGTFDINTTTRIRINSSNITLRGAGKSLTTINATEDITTKPIIQISVYEDIGTKYQEWQDAGKPPIPPEDCTYFNVTIEDLRIHGYSPTIYQVGGGARTDNNAGIATGWARNGTFSNIWIDNCGLGFQPIHSYYLLIEDSLIEENSANTDCSGCRNSTFRNNIYRNATGGANNFKLNAGWCHNEIINNTIGPSSGENGLYIYSGSNDNLIEENTIVGNGIAGIDIYYSYRNIIRTNVIASNSGRGGIGIRIFSLSGSSRYIDNTITNNLIYNNEGEGILVDEVTIINGGKVDITGNTICGNGGPGIDAVRGDFNITNNIIVSNEGYGINYTGIAYIESYNDVWNNTLGNYSGISAGTGDISVDPLFANVANNDLHLKSQHGRWNGATWVTDAQTSPCIDAGDTNDTYSNELDYPAGAINMGAYGNTNKASLGTTTHYDVSGYVKYVNGTGIETAYVINNVTSVDNYTNNMGFYNLINMQNNSYLITATKPLFVSNSTIATIAGADQSNKNITLSRIQEYKVCFFNATSPITVTISSGDEYLFSRLLTDGDDLISVFGVDVV